MRQVLLPLAALAVIAGPLAAETITTEAGHFRVHYPEGAQETAKEVAVVAERAYYQLVTAYNLHEQFRPIDILVTDNIDIGNGFADYYQNQMAVWATNLNYELRGTHDWVRDVVTHELAHIFSLKLAKRYPFRYGLISASVINSSVADFGISLPIYSLVTPSWWVEGIAQYEAQLGGGDAWDTHRDMLLRMATLEDDLLSYDDMGVFVHNWLKSEMIYNQGYALCLYIGDRWGTEMPRTLARETGYVTFNSTLKHNLGMSGSRLYDEWTEHLRARYGRVAGRVGPVVEGTKLIDEGTYDVSPAISPDGTHIAYVSAGKEDYTIAKPRIRSVATAWGEQVIDERVYGSVAWFPSGDRVVYSKFGRGTLYFDLYVYDIARRDERRITSQQRASDAAVSPDGEWIAFVSNEDGGTRLGTVRADGSAIRWLTNDRRSPEKPGGALSSKTNTFIQFYSPRWSADGRQLLFSVFDGMDRDIAVIGTQGPYFDLREALEDSAAFPDTLIYPDAANFKLLLHTTADERDPEWLPDGSGFVYSADYDSIFNIYRYTFAKEPDGEPTITKVTNVLGGAFSPDVSPDGRWMSYVGYHANDFSIYSIPLETPVAGPIVAMVPPSADRDYQPIRKVPEAKQLFRIGPSYGLNTLVGWVPSVRFGPSFIGDKFTVNHLGGGVAVGIDDQSSGRYYFGNAEFAKNLERRDPPSTGVLLYAEQGLTPVLTTESGIAPSLYVYGARYQLGTVRDALDTVYNFLPPLEVEDPSGNRIPVAEDSPVMISDTVDTWDTYSYYYGGLGLRFGLGGGFNAGMEFSWLRFRIEELVDRKVTNYSALRDARTGVDVTRYFPWESYGYPYPGVPLIWDRRPQFRMRYFEDRSATLSWGYGKLTPTVDMMVNPTGGRSFRMAYTVHSVTLTDSLAGTNFDDLMDPLDPAQPFYSSVPRRHTVNELVLSYVELIRMPGFLRRTTLSLLGVAGYQDQRYKYADRADQSLRDFEGWAYWPLRYRLGGGGTLRGYPYFTLEGSKMAFFRATYVFPIIPHFGIQYLSFFHDRTYGAVFAEVGSTWNWGRLQDAWSDRREIDGDRIAGAYLDDWLWDIGFEIRTSAFTFYRLPVGGYLAVARRMSNVPRPYLHNVGTLVTDQAGNPTHDEFGRYVFQQPSRTRVYLGLAIGLGGEGHHPDKHFKPLRRPDWPNAMRRHEWMPDYGMTGWDDMWSPVSGTPRIESPRAPAR